MESTEILVNSSDIVAESTGEKLINNHIINTDLHIQTKTSDSDNFVMSNVNNQTVEVSGATSEAMSVDSSSDTENRGVENMDRNFRDQNNDSRKDSDDHDDDRDVNNLNIKRRSRFRTIIDSDSEDDLIKNSVSEMHEDISSSKVKKRINSDSDSDHNEEINNSKNSEDVEDTSTKTENLENLNNNKSKKFSTLIDSDSEDESYASNKIVDKQIPEEESEDESSSKKKSKKDKGEKPKKKTGSKRAAKDEAMKQIHSETQRLIRESSVSLPYHKAKQRTLEEFLNRKKIVLGLPRTLTSTARLKMSAAIVDEALKEKKKEAEQFFKSDSEDENSDGGLQFKDSPEKLSSNNETCNETKDPGTNILQEDLNEKDIPDAKAAASRRLFDDDSNVDLPELKPTTEETVEIDKDSKLLSPEIQKSSALLLKSLTTMNDDQIYDSENKNKSDVNTDKNDCHENSQEAKVVTSILSSDSNKLTDEDEELLNAKIMTDDEIEKLIEVESKMNEDSLSHSSTPEQSNKENEDPDEVVLGSPLPDYCNSEKTTEAPKASVTNVKKNLLLNVPNIKPKLRGGPGMVIDLTNEVKPNKEAINSLMDRFLIKHSATNKHVENDRDITIFQTETTSEGIKVVKDVVPYKVSTNETEDPELSKPGAKLVRLKEDLKKKMLNKRNEEWKLKERQFVDEEEEEEGIDDDYEFEEKHSKLEDADEDAEESEPEEDDMPIKENKRKYCEFGDDEAEVSEEENVDLSDDENEEDDEEEEDEDKAKEDEIEDDEDDSKEEASKKFSRIVTIDDESNSDNEQSKNSEIIESKKPFERTKTDVDIFEDEEDLPSYQPIRSDTEMNSQIYKTPFNPSHPQSLQSQCNQYSFFSSKSLGIESPAKSIPSLMNSWDIDSTQTQTHESDKKLFQSQDKNITEEELMALCSGNFTQSNNIQSNNFTPKLTGLVDSKPDEPISESQLLDMCSGKFQTQASQKQCIENTDETSQDFKLTFDENSRDHSDNILKEKETKTTPWQSLHIASSSEDEDIEKGNEKISAKKELKKKKKVKQLVLSDDEEDGDKVNSSDEEDEDIESEDEEKFIDYDSEENEVVVVPKKDIKKVAANFLEAEAELSESEWGSEDEDEKGLDKFELEDGDDEEIDEDQMRDQLGKMHARQILDDDQRDVRMLKELLFEDGDLHTDGSGRERKFKWKNIDSLSEEILLKPMDEDDIDNPIDPNEIANEMEWRKFRLEREKFLEEKIRSADDDLLCEEMTSSGSLFKLGMKVLKKKGSNAEQKSVEITSSKTIIPRTVSQLMSTPVGEKSKLLHNAMKKGSFLARGDEALARLAVVVKQTDNVILNTNQSKNFLFAHISPSVNDAREDEKQEETEDDQQSDNKTRKRKPPGGGTPRTTKKAKTEGNRLGKKLF
ncbi:claspin-like [Chelonus insularis]|uniref:claspin-like n=1 Tax=Chelonus insularis TaxID=460826 RepID=UPI00158DFBD7|nr:claspin-like [Chelonus insularis]XP_034941283.1 claspin-like [Chelonus insularis]